MTDRAAIYLRVSTRTQAGEDKASLPIQLRDNTAFCEHQGWEVVATQEDHESGKNITRRGYMAILEMARDKLIDHVVVWAPERFGRRASEVLARYEELKDLKVDVVSVTRPMGDWLSMAIQAVIGENELRVMVSRMAPAKRYRASQGYWVAKPPFGTVNVKGLLQPGPYFGLVKDAFQWCIDGVPLREIMRRFNNAFLAEQVEGEAFEPRTISSAHIRNLLLNPAFIGTVKWDHETHPGLWEPLIDPEVFRLAGQALRERYAIRKRLDADAPYWITGLAWCGACGHKMVAHVSSPNRDGRQYQYLFCARFDPATELRACRTFVPLIPVQDWVVAEVAGIDIEAVVDQITAADAERRVQAAVTKRRLEAEQRRLEERIERAEQGYLDGLWGPERVLQIRTSLKDNISALQRDIAALRPLEAETDVERLRSLFANRDWLEHRDTQPNEFRSVLRSLISKVVVSPDRTYDLALKAGADVYTR